MEFMDGFGRVHDDLRVSVTDRCNLRCDYCLPEEPVWFPREEILAYEEILRLVREEPSQPLSGIEQHGHNQYMHLGEQDQDLDLVLRPRALRHDNALKGIQPVTPDKAEMENNYRNGQHRADQKNQASHSLKSWSNVVTLSSSPSLFVRLIQVQLFRRIGPSVHD